MSLILVAVGANLPQDNGKLPLDTCLDSMHALARLPDSKLIAISPWYRSSPDPPSGQPDYINGIALLHGELEPAALLGALHTIEAAHGRVRGAPNAARTLDLDIIAMGDLIRLTPDPVLPHPRAHLRAFVLRPLLDIVPDWVHPVLGQPGRALLAALDDQPLVRVMDAPPLPSHLHTALPHAT